MRKSWAAILLVVACTPGPAPTQEPKPHPYFPITAGTPHALGSTTDAGERVQCTSCHALTNTTYAQFSCTECHKHAQDAEDPKHVSESAYRYTSASCYACHRAGTVANAVSVGLGEFDPSQNVVVKALVPTWSSTTIVSVSQVDQSLPMQMNHASAQIPAQADTACSNCHFDVAELGGFYPGHFHGALAGMKLAQPSACLDCHASAAPTGFVGPLVAARTPSTGEMKHDWDGGAPLVDCSTCHAAPSTAAAARWSTGAKFHSAVQPGACLDCHANTRPGVLTSATAALPANLSFDHKAPVWLGDCATCHTASFESWTGGKFHLAGAAAPVSCLPCHAAERPNSTDGGVIDPPFDFVTNAQNITHGAGQDCAVCHTATKDWLGGNFLHGPLTMSGATCVACHSTQRPTAPVAGFDHALSGTGDCFGCHQSSNASTHTALSEWAGGQPYPGPNLISSADRFITVTQIALKRGGPNNLVTGTASTQATLYNAMLHTSGALSADAGLAPGMSASGDPATCWHCHPSAPASFLNGQFHSSLTNYRATRDAGITALGQPTGGCNDCHVKMRPTGIVQKSNLQPMDHAAKFTDGGTVIGGSLLDCSTCHTSPGNTWSDGAFHSKIPGAAQAQLADCTVCHYTLMADSTKVDVISAASAVPSFKMQHRSSQITFQKCDRCHATALAQATGPVATAQWAPGRFHSSLTVQPGACVDCHGEVTTPIAPTRSAFQYKGDGQWMRHTVSAVIAKDCAFCHAADAKPSGGAWSASARLHIPGINAPGCNSCHGPGNGGAAINNTPPGLTDSTVITSASASTGVAGRPDQISHADVNVTSRECSFCHTQAGVADAGTLLAGKEWAQASFHPRFTGGAALVMNGSTGRCSNCHLNVKPTAMFTAQDHSAFTATSATDCSTCHQWPGLGTPTAPNWRRTAGAPPSISVGGFAIAQPPAANGTTTQAGLNNLSHPAVPSGSTCTSCHAQANGGRRAFGYDHALAPATGCSACHEAGSDLVGTAWALNAPGATQSPAQCGQGGGTVADRGGDTRPVGIAALACSSNAASLTCGSQSCSLNHFYPSDCGECHGKPAAARATVQTGPGYLANWKFQHYFGAPATQATCCHCHSPPGCRP